MDRAAGVAMAICFSVYVVVGLSGYIFAVLEVPGGVVPGDGLQKFPDDIDVIIARFCIAISVIASYVVVWCASSVVSGVPHVCDMCATRVRRAPAAAPAPGCREARSAPCLCAACLPANDGPLPVCGPMTGLRRRGPGGGGFPWHAIIYFPAAL